MWLGFSLMGAVNVFIHRFSIMLSKRCSKYWSTSRLDIYTLAVTYKLIEQIEEDEVAT